MASNETEAYRIMRMLDVDYALVIFGGMSGYRWVGSEGGWGREGSRGWRALLLTQRIPGRGRVVLRCVRPCCELVQGPSGVLHLVRRCGA